MVPFTHLTHTLAEITPSALLVRYSEYTILVQQPNKYKERELSIKSRTTKKKNDDASEDLNLMILCYIC
jgi:hypothetical protein